jgi:hypothetical protein
MRKNPNHFAEISGFDVAACRWQYDVGACIASRAYDLVFWIAEPGAKVAGDRRADGAGAVLPKTRQIRTAGDLGIESIYAPRSVGSGLPSK